jgi:regulator of replication initiation timing
MDKLVQIIVAAIALITGMRQKLQQVTEENKQIPALQQQLADALAADTADKAAADKAQEEANAASARADSLQQEVDGMLAKADELAKVVEEHPDVPNDQVEAAIAASTTTPPEPEVQVEV